MKFKLMSYKLDGTGSEASGLLSGFEAADLIVQLLNAAEGRGARVEQRPHRCWAILEGGESITYRIVPFPDAEGEQLVEGYQIVDHGWEHSQYFQGCGTAFTPYEFVVTGIGDSQAEAFEDALEQLAQAGWAVTPELEAEGDRYGSKADYCFDAEPEPPLEADYEDAEGWFRADLYNNAWTKYEEAHERWERQREDCEVYYHLSIRVTSKVQEEAPF